MFTVRKVTKEDENLVYDFTFEATAMKWNATKTIPPYNVFLAYFIIFLQSDTVSLIVEDDYKKPVAFFNLHSNGEVGITIYPAKRGKGLGHQILYLCLEESKKYFIPPYYIADIQIGNIPSIKIFERLGFKIRDEVTIKGFHCFRYTKIA